MSNPIPNGAVLEHAQSLLNAGDISGAWAVLAANGDTYADNAAMVTSNNPQTGQEHLFHDLVQNHWEATVGADAYNRYFEQVAKEHLQNYLTHLNDRGTWPNSTDIANSYADALNNRGIPVEAAFDGVWEAVGLGTWWASFLGMEADRIGPESDAFNGINKNVAIMSLLQDILGAMNDVAQRGINIPYAIGAAIGDAIPQLLARLGGALEPLLNALYLRARNFTRRDPLAIDLDGDGIETVGINGGVLFDHNADGIKTGTGWLKGDDAFLVFDRNGNGVIDSGRELFGADTPSLAPSSVAETAFSALAALDSSLDGVFNASDAQFANVRLWRDLNQDGISQSGELQTLAAAGITRIDLAARTVNKTLPGGNTQTLAAGVAGLGIEAAGALNLVDNPFYREYINRLDTGAVAALPDMRGSGLVRDLREAGNDGEWRMAA